MANKAGIKRVWIFFSFWIAVTSAYADVTSVFTTIKNDPTALYAFFKAMPKGGELHYHLAGGAFPEHMLAIAASNPNYCLDKATQSLSVNQHQVCKDKDTQSAELLENPQLYNQFLRAWSLKDFIAGNESAHDHFFAAFYKFIPILSDYSIPLLAEVMKRAAAQHEYYLEIMVLPDDAQSAQPVNLTVTPQNYKAIVDQKLKDPVYLEQVKRAINTTNSYVPGAKAQLNCKADSREIGCEVTVKFLYYILREQPIDSFLSQALFGFLVASQSSDIVGINLVQAEDGLLSLQNYTAEMQIIGFLHTLYPRVHISLHAGELTPELVVPSNLQFHIHDALKIAHAERIGHGVDIGYEDKSGELVDYMAQHSIPVEINLTSNERILNVKGKNHPLNYYLVSNVPVVLSTDDEGILRTDLTTQYVKAVLEHHLDYPTIKQINRNALTYSFLPGKSIWSTQNEKISECSDLSSASCLRFIATSEKATLQRMLELELNQFEKTIH